MVAVGCAAVRRKRPHRGMRKTGKGRSGGFAPTTLDNPQRPANQCLRPKELTHCVARGFFAKDGTKYLIELSMPSPGRLRLRLPVGETWHTLNAVATAQRERILALEALLH